MIKPLVFPSILAGICISLGGCVYLSVSGIAGAVLFGFGLLVILVQQYKLYTGVVGFIDFNKPFSELFRVTGILIFNIVGCILTGEALRIANPSLIEWSSDIIQARQELSPLSVFILAVGCGFIMTAIVSCYKLRGDFWALFLGIPLFILCGLIHCIADAFYISVSHQLYNNYYIAILGNFIGCNLWRINNAS